MKLNISIDLDNAAFAEDPRATALDVIHTYGLRIEAKPEGNLYDINGNFVGTWKQTK